MVELINSPRHKNGTSLNVNGQIYQYGFMKQNAYEWMNGQSTISNQYKCLATLEFALKKIFQSKDYPFCDFINLSHPQIHTHT